jgi:threonine dehydratase
MIAYTSLLQAARRIAPYIVKTPLTWDPENELYLKWENRQATGSFKLRGALNKVLALSDNERGRGLVTASAGNHGQGVASAGRLADAPVIVFASEHAVAAKITAMRSLGAEVRLVPGGYGEAEAAGLQYARESGAVWVSPYNDSLVIAGQGTLALEVLEERPELNLATWVVPGGGGGLISGVGLAIKSGPPRPMPAAPSVQARLIGVQSQASPFLHDLYHTGSQANSIELPSLADGLAGTVEEGSQTIGLVRAMVDEFLLVSEAEIAQAVRFAWQRYGERIEGSAAVGLAAVLTRRVPQRPAVVVISGGNIQPEVHLRLISNGGEAASGT